MELDLQAVKKAVELLPEEPQAQRTCACGKPIVRPDFEEAEFDNNWCTVCNLEGSGNYAMYLIRELGKSPARTQRSIALTRGPKFALHVIGMVEAKLAKGYKEWADNWDDGDVEPPAPLEDETLPA